MSTKFELERLDFASLNGKSAFIIGGGTGPSLSSALALARAGARVTIAANTSQDATVEAFRSQGLAIQFVKCDVTSWSQQLMAFKQAVQFAPSRSLDIVCSFLTADDYPDMDLNTSPGDRRIDVDPLESTLDEMDTNVRAVSYLAKLAMHFLHLPDRATALRRLRSRSRSSSTSYTASSTQSRPVSRPASRQHSQPGSRSESPAPNTSSQESGDALVITEELDQTNEEKKQDGPENKEIEFTKSLTLFGNLSAYVDESYSSSAMASSFALRGLFRSLRTARGRSNSTIRVNLVAAWPTREPPVEAVLNRLADDGFLEREPKDCIAEAGTASLTINAEKDETATPSALEKSDTSISGSATNEGEKKEDTTATNVEESTSKPDSRDFEKPESSINEHKNDLPVPDQQSDESRTTAPAEAITQSAEGQNSGGNGGNEGDNPDSSEAREGVEPAAEVSEATIAQPPATESSVNYKNVFFASRDDIARTIVRLASDSSTHGRAIAVMPDGAYDLKDDYTGGYAGEEVKLLLDKRKESGDVFCNIFKLISDDNHDDKEVKV